MIVPAPACVAETLPLFAAVLAAGTPAPARRLGPDTSAAAAERLNRRDATSRLEADALAFVVARGAGGATFDEWAASRDHPSSQSGRFTALAVKGLIADSGLRRPTRAGSPARVFTATAAGVEVACG